MSHRKPIMKLNTIVRPANAVTWRSANDFGLNAALDRVCAVYSGNLKAYFDQFYATPRPLKRQALFPQKAVVKK